MTAMQLTPYKPTEGCPGQFLRLRGATAAICIGCALHGEPGPQIKPQAAYSPEVRAWRCPQRRGKCEAGDAQHG